MTDVIVIGGGAGGMMAALFAARAGARATLLERTEKTGKKIYITGKGRCNFTNDCTRDEFLQEVPRNPRFLYSALDFCPPQRVMALLEEAGCPVTVQRGRRAFPASEKASDVTRALMRLLAAEGAEIRLHARVQSILTEGGRAAGVRLTDGSGIAGNAVILATGGLSAPGTGSDGDGYRMAAALGHTIVPTLASLIPLETSAAWPRRLQGLSLRNVALTLKSGKKTLYHEQGEMLFTHFGISGPLVLTMSCHLPEDPDLSGLAVTLDLKPALTAEQLDARLVREFTANPRRELRNVLPALLPASFAALFPALCGLDGGKPCGQITQAERARLGAALKALPIPLTRRRPIDEAVVTRGGVCVREVSPRTMESKLVPGLFFAGEVLDLDAHTGGYNLQIAWSTGALAGASAAGGPPPTEY